MFANLQNKINLKRITEDAVTVNKDLAFTEEFDIINNTIDYFKEGKQEINNIVMREEIIEYEDQELIKFLEEEVKAEQVARYNDPFFMEVLNGLNEEDDNLEELQEAYRNHFKVRGVLPSLLEEENKETKMELLKWTKEDHDLDDIEEFEVESLFDNSALAMANDEYLDSIHTINWLEKKLNDYRDDMKNELDLNNMFTIENNLKKLDVNNTEEIKNKIKDVNGSIKILKERKLNQGE